MAKDHLWIDSICINQMDVQERGQQVSMMAEIYFCAITNLIHLGDDDEKAEAAFDSIERIVREVKEHSGGVSLDDLIFYPNQRVIRSTSPMSCDPDFDALIWLFKRPWFSRLWVVQELLLSNRSIAYCGQLSIHMNKILTATGWLQHKLLHLPQSINSEGFWGASNMFMMQNSGHDLTDLLMHLGLYNCTDIRDKVFGGLGLFQQRNETVKGFYGMPDALITDYTKEPARVIRDATRLCIDHDRSLFLLARSGFAPDGRMKGLPTWVPDWYRNPTPGEATTYPPQSFEACGELTTPETLPHPNPDVLSLRGITIGCVSKLTSIMTMSRLEDVYLMTDQLQRIQALSSSTSVSEVALAATLTAGELDDPDNDNRSAFSARRIFENYIKETQRLPPHETDEIDIDPGTQPAVDFQAAFHRTMMWRRFFTTTAGQIGTGPKTLKTGDRLVILPGSTVPFALRKKKKSYVMLGQVYVHGIMHGEALEEGLRTSLQWTTFNIE